MKKTLLLIPLLLLCSCSKENDVLNNFKNKYDRQIENWQNKEYHITSYGDGTYRIDVYYNYQETLQEKKHYVSSWYYSHGKYLYLGS